MTWASDGEIGSREWYKQKSEEKSTIIHERNKRLAKLEALCKAKDRVIEEYDFEIAPKLADENKRLREALERVAKAKGITRDFDMKQIAKEALEQ